MTSLRIWNLNTVCHTALHICIKCSKVSVDYSTYQDYTGTLGFKVKLENIFWRPLISKLKQFLTSVNTNKTLEFLF